MISRYLPRLGKVVEGYEDVVQQLYSGYGDWYANRTHALDDRKYFGEPIPFYKGPTGNAFLMQKYPLTSWIDTAFSLGA